MKKRTFEPFSSILITLTIVIDGQEYEKFLVINFIDESIPNLSIGYDPKIDSKPVNVNDLLEFTFIYDESYPEYLLSYSVGIQFNGKLVVQPCYYKKI